MEVLLTHPDTWETFRVYHRLNLLENESMSAKSIIFASYVFMVQEWAVWAEADREILESKEGWLNDNPMDAGQQLIYKALGSLETYQLVSNCQKKELIYFRVSGDHIQLLHDGSCHWLLAFTSSSRVQVCDSLRNNVTSVSKDC